MSLESVIGDRSGKGLDLLLAELPEHGLELLKVNDHWVSIDMIPPGSRFGSLREQYAIWRETGNVYRLDEVGAVEDDPWLIVTPLDATPYQNDDVDPLGWGE
jgi:hypothetical protein